MMGSTSPPPLIKSGVSSIRFPVRISFIACESVESPFSELLPFFSARLDFPFLQKKEIKIRKITDSVDLGLV